MKGVDWRRSRWEWVRIVIGILGQVWYLIVLIPDLCTLTYLDQGWGWYRESSLSPQVIFLLTVSRRFFLFFCGSYLLFVLISVILPSLLLAALRSPVMKDLTSWLSCMGCFLVFLSLSHMVSLVRYVTWFYRFLIFAFFLTLFSKELFTLLQEFVCKMYASHTSLCKVSDFRYQLFRVKKGDVDSSQLSPCQDTLMLHAMQANYQACIRKRC